MYWEYNSKKVLAPNVPWYALDTDKELTFSLVIESGETFDRAYLAIMQSEYVGTIQAKFSSDSRYMDIGDVSDSNCYLGFLEEGTYSIDFKISMSSDDFDAKQYIIPVVLIHGDGSVGPSPFWCGDPDALIWGEDYDMNPLWKGSYGRCPDYDTGSTCVREHIEIVEFDSTVQDYMVCRAEIGESGKTYIWTRNGMGVEEIFAVGIAKDVSAGELLTEGFITNSAWSWTPDKQLYLDWMTGQMTQTRPEEGWVVICGIAVTATKICFKVLWPKLEITSLYWVLEGSAWATDGNGVIYFYGGVTEGGTYTEYLYSVYIDEMGTIGSQTILTPGGGERRDSTLTYEDGNLYAWGGTDEGGNYVDEMWKYDIATDTWTQLISGGTPRSQSESIVIDGVIYYIGGTDDNGNVTVMDAYTIATDSWSIPDTLPSELIDILENPDGNETGTEVLGSSAEITLMNVPEGGEDKLLSGGLYDDQLYYVINGEPDTINYGMEDEIIHTSFLVYDLVAKSWSKVDTTGGPGACRWGAVAGNYFYAYLRTDRDDLYTSASLWRYNLITSTWTELAPDLNAPNRTDNGDGIFFTDGTKLYVWASWYEGDKDYLSVYDPSLGTWSQLLTPVLTARKKDRLLWIVKNGLLYVYSGEAVSGGDYENEAAFRTINLTTGAIGTWGSGTGVANFPPLNFGYRMSWYEDKYYLFDWRNYEFPYNQVIMFKESGQGGYVPLVYPTWCANIPINYGYSCHVPTVSRSGDDFTISDWSWDMRSSAGYFVTVSVVNGQVIYATSYGDWTTAQVYTWDQIDGWVKSTTPTSYTIGSRYNKITRSGQYGDIYISGGLSNTSCSAIVTGKARI